ncbi:phage tail assembly protein [Vibrio sp. T11.5]|uniref:phage tail assembly protein n=1 Tax=Vibrio sp. T11.5 TaxID=2998836 RepID=UPI0022CD6F15|nr:phage tail assembly protein [Vibrio sp. T11.5]MDA0118542.1 phage tail assembly protein [Vibrio sp. T11.5]
MSETQKFKTEEKIRLAFPYEYNGEQITELVMRRPKVRDQIKLKGKCGTAHQPKVKQGSKEFYDNFDRDVEMFSMLCDVPVDLFYAMDNGDYTKCSSAYMELSQPCSVTTSET